MKVMIGKIFLFIALFCFITSCQEPEKKYTYFEFKANKMDIYSTKEAEIIAKNDSFAFIQGYKSFGISKGVYNGFNTLKNNVLDKPVFFQLFYDGLEIKDTFNINKDSIVNEYEAETKTSILKTIKKK